MAASESSSISATSVGLSKKACEEVKNNNKGKEVIKSSEQDRASNSNSNTPLDFVKLSKDDDSYLQRSKVQELDFFSPPKNVVGLSSCWVNNNNNVKNDEITEEKSSESKTFSCNFCKRQFSSSQALGGHQNAHKPERALAKRRQEIHNAGTTFGHSHFPYYTYPSLSTPHYYGSYNKPLGIRMDSMIHKPSYSWTPPPFRFGQHGHSAMWSSLQEMTNLSSLAGGLKVEPKENNSGVGILGNSATSTWRIKDEVGESSNADTRLKSLLDKSTKGAKSDPHQSNGEQSSDSESSELDLSLKL